MKLIDAEDTLHEIVMMEPPAAMERLTGEPPVEDELPWRERIMRIKGDEIWRQ